MNLRPPLAEALGSFGLTLAVLVSLNSPGFPVPGPVLAGLALGVLVYVVGPVSGAHLNPAVSLGLLLVGALDVREAPGYVVAQLGGAALAMVVGDIFFTDPAELVAAGSAAVGFAELFGTAFLLLAYAAVHVGRVAEAADGILIGGALVVGTALAAHVSNGLLNPAVAVAARSLSAPYVWGPLAGAVVGSLVVNFLYEADRY